MRADSFFAVNSAALVIAIATSVFLSTAFGAGEPDAAKSIVVQYCVKCHVVPGYNPAGGPTSVNAPSFKWIASIPEVYTEKRLEEFLLRPHYPMQGIILSDTDIASLIAFISSLRQ